MARPGPHPASRPRAGCGPGRRGPSARPAAGAAPRPPGAAAASGGRRARQRSASNDAGLISSGVQTRAGETCRIQRDTGWGSGQGPPSAAVSTVQSGFASAQGGSRSGGRPAASAKGRSPRSATARPASPAVRSRSASQPCRSQGRARPAARISSVPAASSPTATGAPGPGSRAANARRTRGQAAATGPRSSRQTRRSGAGPSFRVAACTRASTPPEPTSGCCRP